MKEILSLLFLATISLATTTSVLAQSWTLTRGSSEETWKSITLSADGNQILAIASGSVCRSTDFQNFSTSTFPVACTAVASSADGTKIVALSTGAVYTSTNSGTTWGFSLPPGPSSGLVVSSADGTKLAGGSSVQVSTNSGKTWMQTFRYAGGSAFLSSLASSADGNTLVAGFGGTVCILKDNYVAWSNSLAPGYSYSYVTCSADGSRMAAAFGGHCATPGPIFTTTNSGETWTQTSAPILNWMAIASSADGRILVAAAGPPTYTNLPNLIFTSSDFGATWTPNEVAAAGNEWVSVACSADGSVMAAGSVRGGLWTCRQQPTPTLGFSTAGTNCALSWTVPSANFVLQQSSDLAEWLTVTNPPVLNLTNLKNEVSLPKHGQNAFYRLIAQ